MINWINSTVHSVTSHSVIFIPHFRFLVIQSVELLLVTISAHIEVSRHCTYHSKSTNVVFIIRNGIIPEKGR